LDEAVPDQQEHEHERHQIWTGHLGRVSERHGAE
jgi:hypothetical protein